MTLANHRKSLTRLFTIVMVVVVLGFMANMAQSYYNSMRCIVGMIDTCSQPSDTTIIDSSVYVLQEPALPNSTTIVMANTNK